LWKYIQKRQNPRVMLPSEGPVGWKLGIGFHLTTAYAYVETLSYSPPTYVSMIANDDGWV